MTRYNYFKLTEGFFTNPKIAVMKGMEYGFQYITLLQEMFLLSINTECKLILAEGVPHDSMTLSLTLHYEQGLIEKGIELFKKFGLVEYQGEYLAMCNLSEYIGSTTVEADARRYQRRKKKEEQEETIKGTMQPEEPIKVETVPLDFQSNNIIPLSPDNLISTDVKAVVEEWNKLEKYGIRKVMMIRNGTKRYTMLNARIKEYGMDAIRVAIQNITQSDFLLGRTKHGFLLTFDWFVLPNNFIKVYEGNYCNSKPKSTQMDMESRKLADMFGLTEEEWREYCESNGNKVGANGD